jgi:hypothetical protein
MQLIPDSELAQVYAKIEAMAIGDVRSIQSLSKIQIDCIKFRIRYVGDCELNSDETKVKKIESWSEVCKSRRK